MGKKGYTKLCNKIYTKSYVTIYIIIDGNTHDKPCQLKLDDINCYVYCHIKFSINFDTKFNVSIFNYLVNFSELHQN